MADTTLRQFGLVKTTNQYTDAKYINITTFIRLSQTFECEDKMRGIKKLLYVKCEPGVFYLLAFRPP